MDARDSTYPRYGGEIAGLTDKGFGFIRSGNAKRDLFFHSQELTNVNFDDLREGDSVSFDVIEGPKGFLASNVGKNGNSESFDPDSISEEIEEVELDDHEVSPPDPGTVEFAVEHFVSRLVEIIAADPSQIYEINCTDLERLVALTFSGFGFDVELTPANGDGGKDVIITENTGSGRKSYYVEVKHWNTKVGPGEVQKFLHVIINDRKNGGLFLATSGFSRGAFEIVAKLDRFLGLGTKQKIHTMCENYVRMRNGVWRSTPSVENLLFDDTISEG